MFKCLITINNNITTESPMNQNQFKYNSKIVIYLRDNNISQKIHERIIL